MFKYSFRVCDTKVGCWLSCSSSNPVSISTNPAFNVPLANAENGQMFMHFAAT